MRKFDSGIWQKSIAGGLRRPLGYVWVVGAQRVKAAAAAWLALDALWADCHSPDQQVLLNDLQVLHIYVFLAALLGARHVAQPRADQHQGGVPIRKCPHHAGPAADLAVQPLDRVVGADARPVLAGKIAVGRRLLNAVLDLFGGLLQLHGAQLRKHGLRLLALLGVGRLEHYRL